jgi:hypothetical protein
MNRLKIIPIIIFFSCLFFLNGKSQSSLDNFTYQVYYQTTSTDPAVFDSLCTRVCKVTVEDTSGLAAIKVKVGTTESAGDILQHDFVFDETSGLPTGLTFYREDNVIYLGLMQTYKADTYFYEVQLQDSEGNLSTPILWN